jgi:hypothetical protein
MHVARNEKRQVQRADVRLSEPPCLHGGEFFVISLDRSLGVVAVHLT